MKISVSLEVSEDTGHRLFSLEDLGTNEEDWEQMSEEEKGKLVEDAVNDLPEHPYWCVKSFNED